MPTLEDYRSTAENQWCPGCSNFALLAALKRSLVSLDKAPHEVCLVSGIGQAAKLPHNTSANLFNGLHGRAIPVATGIAAAQPELTVVVTTGDGDAYGEGGNHFLHALRRNPNITVVVHNNLIYALTKGQGSPTTPLGEHTRLQFSGVTEEPVQMLATAIIHEAPFVARGFAGDIEGLSDLLAQAIEHRGFSLVEVLQPCIIWGAHPVDWYRERTEPLPDGHDPHDREAALSAAMPGVDRFPLGVIYEGPDRPVFAEDYTKETGRHPLATLPPIGRDAIEERRARLTWPRKGERA
jgi:2-oxoglutarate/2-oxoacid ferredoxin oxidoreductase subunit beta